MLNNFIKFIGITAVLFTVCPIAFASSLVHTAYCNCIPDPQTESCTCVRTTNANLNYVEKDRVSVPTGLTFSLYAHCHNKNDPNSRLFKASSVTVSGAKCHDIKLGSGDNSSKLCTATKNTSHVEKIVCDQFSR